MRRLNVRGVSTVEFVVVFPIALLVVLCVIQFGFLYMGKLTLNHATFMAARHGATAHADESAIRSAVVRGLVPFYQNSTNTHDATRIAEAHARAQVDQLAFLRVTRISPNERTFADFGVDINGHRQIPNDNLRWRNTEVRANSGVNIQDANLLKIKVVYGYELKVPLMATLVRALMCGAGQMPMQGLGGDVPLLQAIPNSVRDCAFYLAGRVPIESFAVVEMQSPAIEP